MTTRRTFMIGLGATGALASISAPSFGAEIRAQGATAVTQVLGAGLAFVAVAISYPQPLATSDLSVDDFTVSNRTVTDVFPATTPDPATRAETGHVVIVQLSPDDAAASLAIQPERQENSPPGQGGPGGPAGGPGKVGDRAISDTTWKTPQATVEQAALRLSDGNTAPAESISTSSVENLVLDQFQQREWTDPDTGDTLPYNLFVPKDYDPAKSYPLVNFMHDAGATSDDVLMTLKQGLGAICWANPQDQAERPCFVLAPQYAEIIVDDTSTASSMLDTTINLIKALTQEFSIDRNRLYTTGQSGGGMMSIAMNIKYPDFFAASFLVACQWDPALVAPMAGSRLFILVSQDDGKAFPGQNAITEVLASEGAQIARAEWDGRWSDDQFRFAFDDLDAEASPINYVSFAAGTVIPPGESTAGASGHRNTWRIAYSIQPIREWLFRQSKA